MSKKTMMYTAVALAITLIALVAFAGTPTTQGYEAFKDLMKNNQHEDLERGTFTFSVDVIDNGQAYMSASGSLANDETSKQVGGDITLTTPEMTKNLKIYSQDQDIYVLDVATNDLYIGNDRDHDNHHGRRGYDDKDRDFDTKSEAVLDYFVGDMAKDFQLITGQDGSSDILFELTQGEMPAIINILASNPDHHDRDFDDKDDHAWQEEWAQYPLLMDLKSLKVDHPKLVDEVKVKTIKALIDRNLDGKVVGINFELAVSGLDDMQVFHDVVIKGQASFSEEIAPFSPISTEGKQVYRLPEKTDQD